MITHVHIIDEKGKDHIIKISDVRNITHIRGERFQVIYDCPYKENSDRYRREYDFDFGIIHIRKNEFDRIKDILTIVILPS